MHEPDHPGDRVRSIFDQLRAGTPSQPSPPDRVEPEPAEGEGEKPQGDRSQASSTYEGEHGPDTATSAATHEHADHDGGALSDEASWPPLEQPAPERAIAPGGGDSAGSDRVADAPVGPRIAVPPDLDRQLTAAISTGAGTDPAVMSPVD